MGGLWLGSYGYYVEIAENKSMEEYPEIKTKRLHLGRLHWTDVPKIVEYAGHKDVSKTTLNIPYPYEEKDAIFWINSANQGFESKTQYTFAIRKISSDEFIGGIGLKVNTRFNRAEMGYWVGKPFWNKGYTTEAAGAVLGYGFQTLGLHKIHAAYLEENPASGNVMRKNGMIKEAEMKDHFLKDGRYKNIIQYRLTRDEYLGN